MPQEVDTLTAQLYIASGPDFNTFVLIPEAIVTLAPANADDALTSMVESVGEVFSGIAKGLTIPVTAGAHLLLVYELTTGSDSAFITTFADSTSAGVAIAKE